jgi:hypothetical protein
MSKGFFIVGTMFMRGVQLLEVVLGDGDVAGVLEDGSITSA